MLVVSLDRNKILPGLKKKKKKKMDKLVHRWWCRPKWKATYDLKMDSAVCVWGQGCHSLGR